MIRARHSSGFTLVELLVVIVIIGILAAITIIAYNGITDKAHAAVLQSDLSNGRTALGVYSASNGNYPADQSSAGLKASADDTLTYIAIGDGYCLQASGWNQTYYVTDDISSPTSGNCPSGTPPAIASIGTATLAQGANNTVAVPVPSGVSSGSLVLVGLMSWGDDATVPSSSTVTPPSGFTYAGAATYTDASWGNVIGLLWYYKYATGADSGNYSFTLNNLHDTSDSGAGGVALRITGGPASGNPFVDAFHSGTQPSESGTSVSVPSFTPGGDNSLLLGLYFANSPGATTGPSGWTRSLHYTDGSSDSAELDVWSSTQTAATATGALSFSSADSGSEIVLIGTIRP